MDCHTIPMKQPMGIPMQSPNLYEWISKKRTNKFPREKELNECRALSKIAVKWLSVNGYDMPEGFAWECRVWVMRHSGDISISIGSCSMMLQGVWHTHSDIQWHETLCYYCILWLLQYRHYSHLWVCILWYYSHDRVLGSVSEVKRDKQQTYMRWWQQAMTGGKRDGWWACMSQTHYNIWFNEC